MKYFGLFDPFIDGGGDGRHEKNYCGDSLINPQEELINEGDIVSDSGFAGKVLKVGDVLLESIISDPIRVADGFLDEFG